MQRKTKAITSLSPLCMNCDDVAVFIGMVAWFSKFIPRFSKLHEPLYTLKLKYVQAKFCPMFRVRLKYWKWLIIMG